MSRLRWSRTIATHTATAVSGAAAALGLVHILNPTSESAISNDRRKEDDTLFRGGKDEAGQKTRTDYSITNTSSTTQPYSLSPTIPITILRPNPDLEIAFDTRTKNPLYVMERLWGRRQPADGAAASLHSTMRRRPNSYRNGKKKFWEDKSLPPLHRSRNRHYRNSGYDRGHLAPAADFRHKEDGGGRSSEEDDTFNLCNVSPQVPSFNQRTWAQLERWVRQIAIEESERKDNVWTYVVTGPLWLPSSRVVPLSQDEHLSSNNNGAAVTSRGKKDKFHFSYEGIGVPPSLVSVPTHFFKVVAVVLTERDGEDNVERPASIDKFAAFVLPNVEASVTSGGSGRVQLSRHLVRLSDLESVSGMRFFPALFAGRRRIGAAEGEEDTDELMNLSDALTEQVWLLEGERGTDSSATDGQGLDILEQELSIDKRRQARIQRILQCRNGRGLEHLCDNGRCY